LWTSDGIDDKEGGAAATSTAAAGDKAQTADKAEEDAAKAE
jgi:hypothetical protein